MCSAVKYFILLLYILTCEAVELRLILNDTYITASLEDPTPILAHLDTSRSTLFYAHGAKGSPTAVSVIKVVTAFRTKYNVVLLDWSKEAKILLGIIPLSYAAYNVPNTEQVGCRYGYAIVTLIENGLKLSDFFLMGHSLGAHVSGVAGKCAKLKGQTIQRIVGLDPAGPGYSTKIVPGLDSTCADYVVVIRTDPNGYGDSAPIGHVNFYPNYNKTYTMQPGCTEKADPFDFNANTTCNHDRSYELICASVTVPDPSILIAQHADSGDAWLAGQGDPSNTAIITVDYNSGAGGSYFLRTSADYPYGLGDAGMYPL